MVGSPEQSKSRSSVTLSHTARVRLTLRPETRLLAAGASPRQAGSRVTLTYTDLREFRVRLLSLLRFGGIRR